MKTIVAKKISNLITVFIIAMILLNSVIPILSNALSKSVETYINEIGDENIKNAVKDNGDYFQEFLELMGEGTDLTDPAKDTTMEYKNEVLKDAEIFQKYYLDFRKNTETVLDDKDENSSNLPGWVQFLIDGAKRAAGVTGYGGSGQTTKEVVKHYVQQDLKGEDLKSLYEKYLDEKLKDLPEEEREREKKWAMGKGDSYTYAKVDENGNGLSANETYAMNEDDKKIAQTLLEKENKNLDFVGPVVETITKLAVSLADAVLNTLQDMMIPGSPTAVDNRAYSVEIDQILRNRSPEAVVIHFGSQGREDRYNATSEENGQSSPVPFIYYSPLTIFGNKIPAFDINFITDQGRIKNPLVLNQNGEVDDGIVGKKIGLIGTIETKGATIDSDINAGDTKKEVIEKKQKELEDAASDAKGENKKSNVATHLQGLVQKWYVALRNLTMVGLLIVLIYIGIRILISATGEETAKYKTMLKDWFMAIILVMALHYIMLLLITITRILSGITSSGIDFVNDPAGGDAIANEIRTQVSLYNRKEDWVAMMGYGIMYITFVWYIVMFTWRFIKRVIYMAFLTMIAPLVGLTYPLDKIRDGKAQAFGLWFREYLFNLLIQPIDLILYVILVTGALKLVQVNFLYGIVAIGFILQSEKIVKKMFGLEQKLDSGSGNFTAGAVFGSIMTGIQQGSSQVTNALQGEQDGEENNDRVRMEEGDGRTPDEDQKGFLDQFNSSKHPKVKAIDNTPKTTEGVDRNRKTRTQTGNIPKLNMDNSQPETQQPNRPKRKIKRAVGKAANLAVGIVNPNSALNSGLGRVRGKLINTNTAKKAAKLAAMGIGAGTFGLLGVGAGLASDDYSNVFKMGAVGAAGGAILGKELANQVGAASKQLGKAKESFEKGLYGEEYEDIRNQKLDRKWFYSEETRKTFMTKYGKNWKQKRLEALELRKQGITSQKEIDRALKLTEKGFTVKEAGNLIRFANITSRNELLQQGGEQKVYNQVLRLVGGNPEDADRAMKGIKETLNLKGSERAEKIRQTEINKEDENLQNTDKNKNQNDIQDKAPINDTDNNANDDEDDEYYHNLYDNMNNSDDFDLNDYYNSNNEASDDDNENN